MSRAKSALHGNSKQARAESLDHLPDPIYILHHFSRADPVSGHVWFMAQNETVIVRQKLLADAVALYVDAVARLDEFCAEMGHAGACQSCVQRAGKAKKRVSK